MAELQLIEDPDDKRHWTLGDVGELRWEKGMFKNGEATLSCAAATWTLESSVLSSKAKALDASGSEVAIFKPHGVFSRGGEVVVGERTWSLEPASHWKTRFALVDGETELATFETEGWAQRKVAVDLAEEAAIPDEVLLMACWLVRGIAEEMAVTTATVTT